MSHSLDIIVPVRNSLEYLPRLHNTLSQQSSNDFHTILVDDGSTDGTVSFCKDLSRKFPHRYSYASSPGSGPGAARNYGIERSTSIYIGFVDSDDLLHPDYVKLLLGAAPGSDIVECMFLSVADDGTLISKSNIEEYLNTKGRLDQLVNGKISMTSWGKIYRRDYLIRNDVRFLENVRNGEDHIFGLAAHKENPKITLVPAYLYYWCRRPQSLTTRPVDYNQVSDLFTVFRKKIALLKDSRFDSLRPALHKRIANEIRVLHERVIRSRNLLCRLVFDQRLKSILRNHSHLRKAVVRDHPHVLDAHPVSRIVASIGSFASKKARRPS